MRLNNRNLQKFWYAPYSETVEDYDEYGNKQIGTSANYGNPVMARGNISPAKGTVLAREFGDDDQYDKIIAVADRDTPIDEYAVLWVDSVPELDANGALKVNASGEIVTPWDYIVRRVARGLPKFGNALIAISKVTVTAIPNTKGVSA